MAATLASANLYIPKAKLAGETVQVLMDAINADVNAVFEFEDWMTLDDKIVYLPIFSQQSDDPIRTLSQAKFELDVGGKKIQAALPCEPPERFKSLSKEHRIHWYAINLDHLFEDEVPGFGNNVTIRLHYVQPLIADQFYYLPVIIGHSTNDASTTEWKYQMYVRSFIKIAQVISKKSRYERLGDSVVVLLRDAEIVQIR